MSVRAISGSVLVDGIGKSEFLRRLAEAVSGVLRAFEQATAEV